MKNIKNIMIMLFILITSNFCYPQIVTISNSYKEVKKPYDSISNFLRGKYYNYIGQELYLLPKIEHYDKYYRGFLKDYTKPSYNKKNIYKAIDNYKSNYDELVGKYFEVLDIYEHPNYDTNHYKSSDYLYSKSKFLKLKEKNSGDIVYYDYNTEFEHSFPFLVVGYFIKQKEKYIDKKIILSGKSWINGEKIIDKKTGLYLSFDNNTKWTCIDVHLGEKDNKLYMLLRNDKSEHVLFPIDIFESEKYAKKYTALEPKKDIIEIDRPNQTVIKHSEFLSTIGEVIHFKNNYLNYDNRFFINVEDYKGEWNVNKIKPKVLYPEKYFENRTESDSLINKSYFVNDVLDLESHSSVSFIQLIDIKTNDTIYYKSEKLSFNNVSHFTTDNFNYNVRYIKSKISREVDDFTNEIKINSPYEDVMLYKYINNGISLYYIRLSTYGNTANVLKKGLTILFENGHKLSKPNLTIDIEVSNRGGYIYSAWLKLSQSELDLIKTKKISKYRLYIYDNSLDEKYAEEFIHYVKYIQTTK